ncbi:hypothetical protein [Halarcobacter sp.]|uniref:hypothetical protein n=1 Tax=Halarcobacter sp. TaxID=2321133 RepID=UPI002AA77B22|nr:hypothetical protein [Halarcobacter sp.]|eukprot:Anaeramoba_ignava/a92238_38.p3 GENE.a92238_38~~a92238_38.p3  ORF type:complete len:146 (-),score=25.89 a92238_38:1073-1510(-)
MKKLILLFTVVVYSFGITPFNLENVKELNIKILNKKENISKELENKLETNIKNKLEKLGIKTTTDKYINFLVKIKINKIKDVEFVQTSIFISEDVLPARDTSVEALAITYKKDDSFEAEDLENDIYESVVDYLLEDFIEQYKAEN